MENAYLLSTQETIRDAPPAAKAAPRADGWLRFALAAIPAKSRLMPVAYSFADQALAVGGVFLANVVLARTQTKEEYGMFALSYSVFTFLYGLYNAAVVEPFTVFGSGRYREHFYEYLRLMARSSAVIGLLLTGVLFLACLLFLWIAPYLASQALVGLALAVGVLLSATFIRRAFYVQRQAPRAARTSLIFFTTVACGLWLATKVHALNSFSVFSILALGWIVAGDAAGAAATAERHPVALGALRAVGGHDAGRGRVDRHDVDRDGALVDRHALEAAAVAVRDGNKKPSLPDIVPGFKANSLDVCEYLFLYPPPFVHPGPVPSALWVYHIISLLE